MSEFLSLWPRRTEARALPIGSDRELDAIFRVVGERFGVTLEDLKSDRRERWIAWPRQEAMAQAYATGRFSTPRIGRRLGGRDHTTVLYGIAKAQRRRAEGVVTPPRPVGAPSAQPQPAPAFAAARAAPVRRIAAPRQRKRRLDPCERHLVALYKALRTEARP